MIRAALAVRALARPAHAEEAAPIALFGFGQALASVVLVWSCGIPLEPDLSAFRAHIDGVRDGPSRPRTAGAVSAAHRALDRAVRLHATGELTPDVVLGLAPGTRLDAADRDAICGATIRLGPVADLLRRGDDVPEAALDASRALTDRLATARIEEIE